MKAFLRWLLRTPPEIDPDKFLAVPDDELDRLSRDLYFKATLDPTTRVIEAEQRLDLTIRGIYRSCRFPRRDDGTYPKEQAFVWRPDGTFTSADTLTELPV